MAGLFDFVFQSAKSSSYYRDKIDYLVQSRKTIKDKDFFTLFNSLDGIQRLYFVFGILAGENISYEYFDKATELLKNMVSDLPVQTIKEQFEMAIKEVGAIRQRFGNVLKQLDNNKRLELIRLVINDKNSIINSALEHVDIIGTINKYTDNVEERIALYKEFYEKINFMKLENNYSYYDSFDSYMWALTELKDIDIITDYLDKYDDKFINRIEAYAHILLDNSLPLVKQKELFGIIVKRLNDEELKVFIQGLAGIRKSTGIVKNCKGIIPLSYLGDYYLVSKPLIGNLQKELDEHFNAINKDNSKEYKEFLIKFITGVRFNADDCLLIINDYLFKNRDKFNEEDFSELLANALVKYCSNIDMIYEINERYDKVRNTIISTIRKYKEYLTAKDISFIINNISYSNNMLRKNLIKIDTKTDMDFILKNEDIINFDVIRINSKSIDDPKFQEFFFRKVHIKEEEKPLFLDIARYLTSINIDIFKTLNFNLLSKKYASMFEEEHDGKIIYPGLRVIGRYPVLQKSILELNDEDLKVFRLVFKEVVSDDYDYTVLLRRILDTFSERKIVKSVAATIDNYSEEDKHTIINSLIFVLSKNSFVNIGKVETLLNLNEFITKKFNEKTFTSIVDAKNCLLMYKYGLDYAEARSYCNRYASVLNENYPFLTEEDKKIVFILKQIKEILLCDDMNTLKEYVNSSSKDSCNLDFRFSACFEAQIRKMYARVLNAEILDVSSLTECKDNLGVSNGCYFAFDENNPKEFKILLTALGAYSNYTRPDNYADDWFRATDSVHAFCSSLISNQMMGTARLSFACLGFSNVPESNVLLLAPFDIGSSKANVEMDTALKVRDEKVKFMFPSDMIDYTRHTHNEIVIDRMKNNGKMSPDYSLLILEHYSPSIIKRWKMKMPLSSEKNDYLRYCNAVQAANDFGIPLVILDRSKVKAYEKKEIRKMIEEYKVSHDSKLLYKILLRFENNRAGTRSHWLVEGFDLKDTEELFREIFNEIDDLALVSTQKAMESLDEIAKWINLELQEKVGRKGAMINKLELGFAPEEILSKISKKKKNLQMNAAYSMKDFITLLASDKEISLIDAIEMMDEGVFSLRSRKKDINSSLDISQIVKDVLADKENIKIDLADKDMMGAYMDFNSRIHGMSHIEDVVLFTSLMVKKTFKDKPEIARLCIEAAKYHDSGRVDDGKSDHALASAEKYLRIKEKDTSLSLRDKAIIYTAICAHDAHMGDKLNEYIKEKFLQISRRIGNKDIDDIGTICIICRTLRDADALDRTRFRDESRSFVDVNRLSSLAKKYVDFALRVSEYQSLIKIRSMLKEGIITEDDIIKCKDASTPKELQTRLNEIVYQRQQEVEKGKNYGK